MAAQCSRCGAMTDQLDTAGVCEQCRNRQNGTNQLQEFWRDCKGAWFPVQLANPHIMTLRDLFAAFAVAGLLAADTENRCEFEDVAKYGYMVADEMERVRQRGSSTEGDNN